MRKTRGRGKKRARKDETQEDAESLDNYNASEPKANESNGAQQKDNTLDNDRKVDNRTTEMVDEGEKEQEDKNATNGRVEEESDEDAFLLYRGHGKSNKEIRRGNECPYLDTISRQVRGFVVVRCCAGA